MLEQEDETHIEEIHVHDKVKKCPMILMIIFVHSDWRMKIVVVFIIHLFAQILL